MNRIETIIQKFDINPCTLSHMEAREYLYYLYDESKPLKNKELTDENMQQFNNLLERLKIVEIFYDALMHSDSCAWLEFDKLVYRVEHAPELLDSNELSVLHYYLQKKLKEDTPADGLEKMLLQVRTLLKANRA